MPAGDKVRSKIILVETAIKSAGADNAINAIVDVLKEIALALDDCTETPNLKKNLEMASPAEGRVFKDIP